MKKFWKRVKKSPSKSGDASPKSGSTRGSVASLNVNYEVKEKDLAKLHKAAWFGDLTKVKQLAKKDPSPLDKENRTPLHLACVKGNDLVVQELLEWKAKANIGDNQARTPLMRAVEFQNEGCVHLLLEYRVDLDTTDGQGYTALHLAVGTANIRIITLLSRGGANLDTRNKEGMTPLHMAVKHKQEDVARLLLKEGANVDAEDPQLRTPLFYACQDGSSNLVQLILSYNPETFHKDSKGWCAEDCAIIQGHHACSQLISDHNMKHRRTSNSSTPRSSMPPSIQTPRDKNSIGAPVFDGEESDQETLSRASGGPGSDSWADSPDVSIVDDKMKPKTQKINISKFAKNIQISESDTDGESVKSPVPKENPIEEEAIAPKLTTFADAKTTGANNSGRQTSWQSQTSGEDNSWGDSPVTPRKSLTHRVSFKKDEELSEVHDIPAVESETESSEVHENFDDLTSPAVQPIMTSTPGKDYFPTKSGAAGGNFSSDKTKSSGLNKPALMEELGIDPDDLSDLSEPSSAAGVPPPPLPASQPPAHGVIAGDSDWDTSVVSEVNTPRPGILKKTSFSKSQEEMNQELAHISQTEKPEKPKLLIKASAVESDDESSAWDTTEADNPTTPQELTPAVQIDPQNRQRKKSVTEWDSDVEDLLNPVGSAIQINALTPTPPPPPASATISKEVELIVRQKQAEQESDGEEEEDSVSIEESNKRQPSPIHEDQLSMFMPSAVKTNQSIKDENDNDDDDIWDSTTDAVTPRIDAVSSHTFQVNGYSKDIEETFDSSPFVGVTTTPAKPVDVQEVDDEDDDSDWDSEEKDEIGAQLEIRQPEVAVVNDLQPTGVLAGVTVDLSTPPAFVQTDIQTADVVDSDDSDPLDSETQSSWEIERKQQKMLISNRVTSPKQREMSEADRLAEQKFLDFQLSEEIRQKDEQEKEDFFKIEEEKKETLRLEEERRKELEKLEEERVRQEEERLKQEEQKLREAREEAERIEQRRREKAEEELLKQEKWRQEEEEEAKQLLIQEELEKDDAQIYMEIEDNKQMDEPDSAYTEGEFPLEEFELNRINEKFEQERFEREQHNPEVIDEDPGRRGSYDLIQTSTSGSTPVPHLPSSSGIYVNINNSTTEQLRQQLQVPNVGANPVVPNAGLSTDNIYDDAASLLSEEGGDENRPNLTQSYQASEPVTSLYLLKRPIDDDALSYTSTEFEDAVNSSAAYARDRDVFSNLNISDPGSLLKVQEYVGEWRQKYEKEKNQKAVLENKLRVINKEKLDLNNKLESVSRTKSTLEQNKLDLESKIRSLQYGVTEEEEKRKNAEILLSKTKDQLSRKEALYAGELEAKQNAELQMRNLQIELRSYVNTIKELEEEKDELTRQVSHAQNARVLQQQINEDQQKLFHHQQQQQQQQSRSVVDQDILDLSGEMSSDVDKLKAQLYAQQMETERQRSRLKDELSLVMADNEEINARMEEMKNSKKLTEEALDKAVISFNMTETSLKAELSAAVVSVDREKSQREKSDAEVESLRTRLLAATQEKDNISRARNEIEREQKRQEELWTKELERKEGEITLMKNTLQQVTQKLDSADSKLNSLENELRVSNTSLMERTSQLQQLKVEMERTRTSHEALDQSLRLEKDQSAKLQAKIETIQERLSSKQHENVSLRQELDAIKLSGGLPGNDANEKLNNILQNLRADSDKAKATLEERNNSLVEQVARLKEEVRMAETRRTTLEADVRRLQDENSDMVRKLSQAEASLHVALSSKEQLEQERAQLKVELEKQRELYQASHLKSVEAQARISELVDRLEKAENTSLVSSQQLASQTATFEAVNRSKADLDENLQQLQVENTRLDAELRFEKQRAEMLQQDLQDSQKVRSSLEALCSNLKSTSAHLEDKLGIADLENKKHSTESKIGLEKNRAENANEERKFLESQLDTERDRNNQLQKDVNTLKMHLKSARNKIKEGGPEQIDSHYSDFQKDVQGGSINRVSTPVFTLDNAQGGSGDDMKAELEAKYRAELNRKLGDVNRFLDSQTQARDRLDTSRTEVEVHLLSDKRKLEEENNSLRVKYEQAVSQRETKEMEARRFRELYESEMKWRMRISEQLAAAQDRGTFFKSKLGHERSYRHRLAGSIGNLNSSMVSNYSLDVGRLNGYHDDELTSKIRAELDKSIAKHLEAAPHDRKPIIREDRQVNGRLASSLTQSTNDYFGILKRKYAV